MALGVRRGILAAVAVSALLPVSEQPRAAADPLIDGVVTAVALEPDPQFARFLVGAAVEQLGTDDADALAELLAAVLLVLPEDAARDLAPDLLAQAAGTDDDLLRRLAEIMAGAVGVEAGDMAARAQRLQRPTPMALSGPVLARAGEPARSEPVRLQKVFDGMDHTLWLDLLLEARFIMSDQAFAEAATALGLSMADLELLLAEDDAEYPREVVVIPVEEPPEPGETASPW